MFLFVVMWCFLFVWCVCLVFVDCCCLLCFVGCGVVLLFVVRCLPLFEVCWSLLFVRLLLIGVP